MKTTSDFHPDKLHPLPDTDSNPVPAPGSDKTVATSDPGSNPRFSLEELEILANAYLDCRLSLLEEKQLALILANCPYDSPILSEARLSMDLELSMTPPSALSASTASAGPVSPAKVSATQDASGQTSTATVSFGADKRPASGNNKVVDHFAASKRKRITRICSVAAAAAIIIGVGVTLLHQSKPTDSGVLADDVTPQLEVVMDGQVLSGNTAELYANQMEAQHMEMMYSMLAASNRDMAQNINLLNDIKQ